MATADFIMPRLPDASSHNHFGHRTQPIRAAQAPYQSRYNPQISPPSNMKRHSPTSPKGGYQPSRRPLFVPAVLRPNEFPSKEPPTRSDDESAIATDTPVSSTSSFMNLTGLGAIGRLSRRSTNDSSRSSTLEPELNVNLFPVVSAPPTRKHWKVSRRAIHHVRRAIVHQAVRLLHPPPHCRRCGNIFCDPHSSHQVPLDEEAHFNPRGAMSRSCVYCFGEFRLWHSRTSSQASSETSSTTTRPATRASTTSCGAASSFASTKATTAPNSPTKPTSASAPHGEQQQQCGPAAICAATKPLPHHTEVALSVPRDWNWSTF
ncbi:hypothetical protein MAPG_07925 [Magnaporthiopsis poae ATCC 64411]|uniref:FYVE zinc finger domain-containing protein n=1 Tax=Magnaporthiopsis poae (strain ATCC 64411 / 73-15) TaxID=644358 RepID=A0A0C4E5Z6_MAGP6|nr:hypothetical protein MAPG_07925 [Magnaporthiopsis poae ATCC 64411]